MRRFPLILALLGLLLLLRAPARAAGDAPYRVAAGVNLGGGQIDWRLNHRWMIEARGQTADAGDTAKTRATLFGARAYRFFNLNRPSVYMGFEGASVTSTQSASHFRASGFAAGAFAGLELKLLSHVFLMVDAGPYEINLKEDRTRQSISSTDFVADAALVVGF